jgi:hypothetical protein
LSSRVFASYRDIVDHCLFGSGTLLGSGSLGD